MKRVLRAAFAVALVALPLLGTVGPAAAASPCRAWWGRSWTTPTGGSCGAATAPAAGGSETERPLVFGDDFDVTGDLSRWDGRRDLKNESADVYSGKYAMRATSTGSPVVAQTILPDTYDEVYYRVRFKIISQGANSVYLLRVRTANNDAIVGLFVSSTGGLGFRNDVTGANFTSPTVITRGQWHEIQVRVKVKGRESQIAVWLNGHPIDSLSQTVWLGASPIGRIELGDSSGGRTFDAIFDDVAIDTAYIPSDRVPAPLSGVLTIRTSPAMAGVPFVLDKGRTFYTDAQGMTRVEVDRWSNDLRLRITVPETDIGNDTRVRLARWFSWSNSLDADVTAALDISVPVTWAFVDLAGKPVDSKLVTSISLKSSTGVVTEFDTAATGTPQFLHMSRQISTQSGPETKYLYYTVEQVMVGGSNVVIKSRSKFFPQTEHAWTIPLMFYSARFQSKDAFFGFPIGKQLKVVAPDGEVTLLPLDSQGEAFIPALARGEYQVSVIGPGYSPPRPIAVSRDQESEMKVFSYLDMAVCGAVIAGFAFGLLFLGRPKLLSPRFVLGWAWNEIQRQSRGVLAR